MTLYLRSVSADRKSYGGFQWPSEVGSRVEAPDWRHDTECGHGLHGLAWGEGEASLLNQDQDAVWQVVEYDGSEAVDLRGKHKFPWCVLRYDGDRDGAIAYLTTHGGLGRAIVFSTATAGYRGTLIIRWFDQDVGRYRVTPLYPGEDGIEPDVAYRLDDKGRPVRAEGAR